jgi:hypothetical protein
MLTALHRQSFARPRAAVAQLPARILKKHSEFEALLLKSSAALDAELQAIVLTRARGPRMAMSAIENEKDEAEDEDDEDEEEDTEELVLAPPLRLDHVEDSDDLGGFLAPEGEVTERKSNKSLAKNHGEDPVDRRRREEAERRARALDRVLPVSAAVRTRPQSASARDDAADDGGGAVGKESSSSDEEVYAAGGAALPQPPQIEGICEKFSIARAVGMYGPSRCHQTEALPSGVELNCAGAVVHNILLPNVVGMQRGSAMSHAPGVQPYLSAERPPRAPPTHADVEHLRVLPAPAAHCRPSATGGGHRSAAPPHKRVRIEEPVIGYASADEGDEAVPTAAAQASLLAPRIAPVAQSGVICHQPAPALVKHSAAVGDSTLVAPDCAFAQLLAAAKQQPWSAEARARRMEGAMIMRKLPAKAASLGDEADDGRTPETPALSIACLADLQHAVDIINVLAAQIAPEDLKLATTRLLLLLDFEKSTSAPRLALLKGVFELFKVLFCRSDVPAAVVEMAADAFMARVALVLTEYEDLGRVSLAAGSAATVVGSLHLPLLRSEADREERRLIVESRRGEDKWLIVVALRMAQCAISIAPGGAAGFFKSRIAGNLLDLSRSFERELRKAALGFVAAVAECDAPGSAADLGSFIWPALMSMLDNDFTLRRPSLQPKPRAPGTHQQHCDVVAAIGSVAGALMRHRILQWDVVQRNLLAPHGAPAFWTRTNAAYRNLGARLLTAVLGSSPELDSADLVQLTRAWIITLGGCKSASHKSAAFKLTQQLSRCPSTSLLFDGVIQHSGSRSPSRARAVAAFAGRVRASESSGDFLRAAPQWAGALIDAVGSRCVHDVSTQLAFEISSRAGKPTGIWGRPPTSCLPLWHNILRLSCTSRQEAAATSAVR